MNKPEAGRPVQESDLAIASGQLGREARDVTGIAVRCSFGRPVVIETASTLDGKPNPTLLYLTCPTANAAVSRVEAQGGVKHLKALCREDPRLRQTLLEVARAYRERRSAVSVGQDPRPEAGIGGPTDPEKASCLHAYGAALLAALGGWFLDRDVSVAAERVWDRFLPPRTGLWCGDDRCERWAAGENAEAGKEGPPARLGESVAPAANDEEVEPAKARKMARPAGAAGPVRVAAIDMGTISVRLLVADIRGNRPIEVIRRAEITRLGEGLVPGGRLNPAARERTAAVVATFIAEARRLGAGPILLAGTSACREAADGPDFVDSISGLPGVTGTVLSGADEATLAYTGAALDVLDDVVVLDVGGGSTELMRRGAGGHVETRSLQLGASRGTERWITSDPPLPTEMEQVRVEAAALVGMQAGLFSAVAGRSPLGPPARLVGVAGTVTTLACLDAGLGAYDPDVIHLRTLTLASVERLASLLARMTNEERAALPCVQVGRAPVIVAGALIVAAIMQALGYTRMTVSERDILDGLALSAAC